MFVIVCLVFALDVDVCECRVLLMVCLPGLGFTCAYFGVTLFSVMLYVWFACINALFAYMLCCFCGCICWFVITCLGFWDCSWWLLLICLVAWVALWLIWGFFLVFGWMIIWLVLCFMFDLFVLILWLCICCAVFMVYLLICYYLFRFLGLKLMIVACLLTCLGDILIALGFLSCVWSDVCLLSVVLYDWFVELVFCLRLNCGLFIVFCLMVSLLLV